MYFGLAHLTVLVAGHVIANAENLCALNWNRRKCTKFDSIDDDRRESRSLFLVFILLLLHTFCRKTHTVSNRYDNSRCSFTHRLKLQHFHWNLSSSSHSKRFAPLIELGLKFEKKKCGSSIYFPWINRFLLCRKSPTPNGRAKGKSIEAR